MTDGVSNQQHRYFPSSPMIIPGCNPQTFRHGSFGLNYLYVDKTISKAIACLTHEARF